jgi:hypothetical protein
MVAREVYENEWLHQVFLQLVDDLLTNWPGLKRVTAFEPANCTKSIPAGDVAVVAQVGNVHGAA